MIRCKIREFSLKYAPRILKFFSRSTRRIEKTTSLKTRFILTGYLNPFARYGSGRRAPRRRDVGQRRDPHSFLEVSTRY